MDLEYLRKLKSLENEFGSSQRKAYATATVDENQLFYISLSFFSNMENIESQDKNFEITNNIMPSQKIGTALVEICSNFDRIEKIIYKYVELCEKIEYENSGYFIETQIIKPLFLELSEENIYFKILKDFEFQEYEKELKTFKKRKESILNFKEEVFNNIILETDDEEIKTIHQDVIDTNKILKNYINDYTIKCFVIDYLKAYLLEIRELIELLNIYSNISENNIYNRLNNNQKIFLFNILENPINTFMFPVSKVEPKIKIDNLYINIWDFEGKYLYKSNTKNKEQYKKILLDYINGNNIELFTTYRITTIKELLNISLMEILKNKLTIKKCENCKKYFITENRTDEKYCNRISPQNPKKTCKEYGVKKIYRDKLNSDMIRKSHYNTSQYFRMKKNRCKNEKEKEKIIKDFEKYKTNYEKNKRKYNNKKITEIEFTEWINEQKNLKKKDNKDL